MWRTLMSIVFIAILVLILHDIGRIIRMQDELMKEQYVMRGELNAILDMASLGNSFMPKFSFADASAFADANAFANASAFADAFIKEETKDDTTTVEINETKH